MSDKPDWFYDELKPAIFQLESMREDGACLYWDCSCGDRNHLDVRLDRNLGILIQTCLACGLVVMLHGSRMYAIGQEKNNEQ